MTFKELQYVCSCLYNPILYSVSMDFSDRNYSKTKLVHFIFLPFPNLYLLVSVFKCAVHIVCAINSLCALKMCVQCILYCTEYSVIPHAQCIVQCLVHSEMHRAQCNTQCTEHSVIHSAQYTVYCSAA